MKTRKKTLFLSMLGVFLFTAGCMLLNTIDKPLPESLIEKFYNYCTWVVVGSGVCGVVAKREDRIKELHNISQAKGSIEGVDEELEYTNQSMDEEETGYTECEEIMHGDEF